MLFASKQIFRAILSAIILSTPCIAFADFYEYRLGEIDKAVADSDWHKADSLIVDVLKANPSNPSNPLLLSNLGMIRFYAGDDVSALETLTAAHEMAPNSVVLLANRARVLTAVGRSEEAIADYDNIERLDSTYSDTYLYRGLINLYSGNFEKASKDFDRLSELAPDKEDTLIALASYHTITGSPEDSHPFYDKLLRIRKSPEYYAGRAMALIALDRLYDAAEDIAEGLSLDENYGELYLCRALLNKKRYQHDQSLADAQQAISLGVNPIRVKAMLGL